MQAELQSPSLRILLCSCCLLFVRLWCVNWLDDIVIDELCFCSQVLSTAELNMFGFHKSKIYRSNDGCCICKTKSSSSRFTDSSRYEETFRLCFGWGTRFKGLPGSVIRNNHTPLICILSCFDGSLFAFSYICVLLIDKGYQKIEREISAMPVCCWWRDGKSYQKAPIRTGIM